VRTDPKAVLKLRCLFLKLRSMLELPLLRIGQDTSPAAGRVADFYSASLLTYVRKVLQVGGSSVDPLGRDGRACVPRLRA